MSSIGVDVGGTKIVAGLVHDGRIITTRQVPTEAGKGRQQVIRNLFSAIDAVNDGTARSIGIGHPGPINFRRGIIGNAVNLPMRGVHLKDLVARHYPLPVSLDNDAKCFTLGEALYGKGKGKDPVLGLTLGTGIGSGLYTDGKLYHGRGNAMEVGHLSIVHDGRLGRCGNPGCFERYAGTVGLLQTAEEHHIHVAGGKELAELVKRGNKEATITFTEFGYHLGVGLTTILHCFDPEIIIIGGNLTRNWKLFYPYAKAELQKRALFPPCPIVRSTLQHAAVLGAASLSAKS